MPHSETHETADNMATVTVSDLSDEDVLIQYCLQNKINKTAIDELLKRGFDSLEALKLVKMEDLSSQFIPMGQRRLIFHIAQTLRAPVSTSGDIDQSDPTVMSEGNSGVSHQSQNTGAASGGALHQSTSSTTTAPLMGNTGVSQALPGLSQLLDQPQSQNLYSQTLLNSLLRHQTQFASLGQTSAPLGSVNMAQIGTVNQEPQSSWNDPQIHIASATGKSTSTFYDVCDFVPHSLDEELVVGGQGEHQVVIKSGPKKPKLESLTLSQWSIANLAILYKLVCLC